MPQRAFFILDQVKVYDENFQLISFKCPKGLFLFWICNIWGGYYSIFSPFDAVYGSFFAFRAKGNTQKQVYCPEKCFYKTQEVGDTLKIHPYILPWRDKNSGHLFFLYIPLTYPENSAVLFGFLKQQSHPVLPLFQHVQ